MHERLGEMEREREMLRHERAQAFLAQTMQRMSPRALVAQRRAAKTASVEGEGGALAHLPPRERAAAAKLENERRRRWLMLIALGCRASTTLDLLVWDRNSRDENKEADRAARLIQRKHGAKIMRKQLTALNKSVQCLRNNVMRFAFEWKLRKKRRSMDTIREFLEVVTGKSSIQRKVHEFLYKVIKIQRKWRRFATIIAAQLGIFSLQFSNLLREKKSAEMHLTAEEHKKWSKKISKLMLESASKDTRAGQRDQARAEKAAAAEEAAAAPEGADADGEAAADADKGKKKGKKGGAPSAAAATSELSRFGIVDLDCKMLVLSRCLRRRKVEHRFAQREYLYEKSRADKLIAKNAEIEAVRRMVAGPDERAKGGVTDLAAAAGEFSSLVTVEPPPRPSILLRPEEVRDCIVEALMLTADKMAKGEKVDALHSVGGVRLMG